MKRLRRRSRWTSRRQKHSTAGSLSCLPVSLLCRGLPSPVEESSATALRSHYQRFSAVDDVNHVDRRASGNVEQPGKNEMALLGGNGLQSYDDFIATLLKERSLVKDGVPADTEKLRINKSPQTLTTRLRQRRPLAYRREDEQRASGYDSSSLPGEVRKPDDGSSRLKSAVVSKDVWINTMDKYVHEHQPQTERDAGWSATETTTNVVRNTSTKLDSLEHSPRQRQRQRRRKPKPGRQGATTVTEGCDSATPQTRVQGDYNVTTESATALVSDSISEHCGKAAVDKRQDTEESGRDLAASCAYRGRFDRVSTTTTSHDPDYEQFRRITTTVSDDFKPAPRRNRNAHQQRDEEAVDLLAFPVDSMIIPFIDCDSVEEVEEGETKIASVVMDRWQNTEGEVTYSSLRTRASSLQSGGRVMGVHMPDIYRESSVCRRSTPAQCNETTVHVRRRRQCRSYPSLSGTATDQISEFDASAASLDQLRTHGSSQLLETCKCSISWPMKTVSLLVHSDEMNDELNERRSPRMTRRPITKRNTTTDVSAAPQLNLQMSNDVNHNTTECQQHLVGAFTSLPSNDVAQLHPEKSDCPLRHTICANRHDVQVHGVFARRRQEKPRCGGKTSKCLLRIEFMLTCSQVEDQRTTLVFARRNTTVERDQVVAGDSGEVDDGENLSFSYSSTCSTSDVTLTVTSDDIDDVINDAELHVDTTLNCTAMDVVESLTITQLSSIDGAFATSPRNCADGSGSLAADIGSVNASIPREITSGNLDDVSQSLTVYEFAEVTSIFRHFDADLLPTTSRELSVVPYGTARREGGSPSAALVPRAAPGVTYSGAVEPFGTPSPVSFRLPLMTWTWSHDDFPGSLQQETHDDVTHIPYVSACTTLNIEPLIDHFTLVRLPSRSKPICSRHERAVHENMVPRDEKLSTNS